MDRDKRWQDLHPQERSHLVDSDAKEQVLLSAYHSTHDEIMNRWVIRAKQLISHGTPRLEASKTCYFGFFFEHRTAYALHVFKGMKFFEFPSSREITTPEFASLLSVSELEKYRDSIIKRYTFCTEVLGSENVEAEIETWIRERSANGKGICNE